jgi:hypothetical protein
MGSRMKGLMLMAMAGWSLSAAAGPGPARPAEVSYRAGQEVRVERGRKIFVRATVEAVDLGTGQVLWSMDLRDEKMKGGREAPISSISPYGKGLVVVTEPATPDPGRGPGAPLTYLIDTNGRKSERVFDARGEPGECEVHRRPLLDDTVRLRFGKPRSHSALIDEPGYPHANTVHLGGCVVGEAERALVRYCPACREIKARKYPTPEEGAG